MADSSVEHHIAASVLGETRGPVTLCSWDHDRRAAAALAQQARRRVDIFTPDLEPALYDQRPFLDGLRRLALTGRGAQIRILARDSARAVSQGHRLFELARQLTSYIAIRRTHHDYDECRQAFLLADVTGWVYREFATRYEGQVDFNGPGEARKLLEFFDEVWECSDRDPEAARLYL